MDRSGFRKTLGGLRRASAVAGSLMAMVLFVSTVLPAAAQEGEALTPQTRVRLTVLQWLPVKGSYEKWEALSGEFSVSDQEQLTLPVIGQVSVSGANTKSLAATIAKRIQDKTGLVALPNALVEVVDYPPIYVAGDITAPGEYKYRSGMSVVHAIALGRGLYRDGGSQMKDQLQIAGDLRAFEIDRLRGLARIARLEAEASGAQTVAFPVLPADPEMSALVAQVYAQERVIFEARANELQRQSKSLRELKDLLEAEISVLQEKIRASEKGEASAVKELAGVEVLVKKGIAVASRQSEMERMVASYQSERLDRSTQLMRARQSITEATRALVGLEDKRRTEVSSELQAEQGRLNILKVKEEVARQLMADSLSTNHMSADSSAVSFSILRRVGSVQRTLSATEQTPILPGDVVMVKAGDHRDGDAAGRRAIAQSQ